MGQIQPSPPYLHGFQGVPLGLLGELRDNPIPIDLHEPKVTRAIVVTGNAPDGDVGVTRPVRFYELHVVHAVEVVTRQDHHVLNGLVLVRVNHPRVLQDKYK